MSPEDRFWSKVKRDPEGCWEWQAYKAKTGYGWLGSGYAHRFAYEYANGEIPQGQIIRHACDNRACVRPSHLLTGDRPRNSLDMHERGRFGAAKLTWEQVDDIRRVHKPRSDIFGSYALALNFGVCRDTIDLIVGRAGRRHLWTGVYSEARRGKE
jgi:hypothetical protein